jgi:hypothetical protein
MNNPIPSYSMYTRRGDAAVHGLVIALRHMGDLPFTVMQRRYVIRSMLKSLADSHEAFAEANDTAVADCVLYALGE